MPFNYTHTSRRGRGGALFLGMAAARLLTALVLIVVAALVAPRVALARSFEMTKVDIDATVGEDGSLAVRETRRFAFDGSFNGVYWRIPAGTYEGRAVGLSIEEAQVKDAAGTTTLQRADTEREGTFQLIEDGDVTQVKLFSPHKDAEADFTLSFTYSNLASRWQDTAELYWQFVCAGWDEASHDVTCRIHLPVPAGEEVVAGKNVRVWGHGSLDGHVEIVGSDVVYTVPQTLASEFAEARVLFPAEWLAGVEPSAEARSEAILAEEQRWAEEANATRAAEQGRRVRDMAIMGACAVTTAAFATWRKVRHARLSRDAFAGEYFRDIPSTDHPVVLSSLLAYREEHDAEVVARLLAGRGTNGMPASLMRLASEGVVRLVRERGEDGRLRYRIQETGGVGRAHTRDASNKAAKAIDRATCRLLFDVIADQPRGEGVGAGAPRSLLISDFEQAAKTREAAYKKGWEAWGKAVADAYAERGFKTEMDTSVALLVVLAVVDVLVALGVGVLCIVDGVHPAVVAALAVALVAAAVWCIRVELATMYVHTPEAYDLMGKTEALRRWLCDFTRLREAVPTDVVLWNEMLVLATALGVSKEVLKQLRVKVPKLLANPSFTAYDWYRDDEDEEEDERRRGRRRRTSPMDALTASVAAADAIARPERTYSSGGTDSYGSSDRSSGSGSGGGFSSGGGGGFGSGGGGGAF